jgi:hypothetical protein
MTEPAYPADSEASTREEIAGHVSAVAKKTREFEAGIAEVRARAQALRAHLDRPGGGQIAPAPAEPKEPSVLQASSDPSLTWTPIADFRSSISELAALRQSLHVAHHGLEGIEEPYDPPPRVRAKDALIPPDRAAPIEGPPPIPAFPRSRPTLPQALDDPDSASPIPAWASVVWLNGESFSWTNGKKSGRLPTEPEQEPEAVLPDARPDQPTRTPRTTVVARPGQPAAPAGAHNTQILPNPTDQHLGQPPDPGSAFLATNATTHHDGHSDGPDQSGWVSRVPSNLMMQLGAALVIVALVLIKFG